MFMDLLLFRVTLSTNDLVYCFQNMEHFSVKINPSGLQLVMVSVPKRELTAAASKLANVS